MRRAKTLGWLWLGTFLTLLPTPVLGQDLRCDQLSSLHLPHGNVTVAHAVAAGAFVPPTRTDAIAPDAFRELPAFCRVAATLKPATDSDIKIEVWLPMVTWNGKFQGVGNGGFAGTITYSAGRGAIERGMSEALKRGYATASTDTGHSTDQIPAFLGNGDKLVDFGYRAVHEMTVAAKLIVNAFYGARPKLSYWNGCSTGGRQGLMEAQRFPADYDGIIAGAPANPQSRLSAWNVYVGQVALKNPTNTIPPSKYPMIHEAVVNACDSLDGVKDGLIGDPSQCRFDFKSLACKGDDSPACLTAGQIETARTVTSAAIDSKTKKTIFPGLALGSELGWGTKIGGPNPSSLGTDYFKYAVFSDPTWDWRTFDLQNAVARADRVAASITDASNPDLVGFKQRGGKLLLFHGWQDQNFSAQSTINYYRSVLDTMSSPGDWMRLFLAPGIGHCGGGEGPNAFDAVSALEEWVEKGQIPSRVIATRRTDGKVDRTRPLCPYPSVAFYTGKGSTDDAVNFVCRAP